MAGPALGDEPKRGEGRKQEGVRGRVDEVGEGDERGGEADRGSVQRRDEDLRVRVEGVGEFEVVGDEVAEGFAPDGGVGGKAAGESYVGAAGRESKMLVEGVFRLGAFCGG